MRLKGQLEAVPDGWAGGIIEDAEPGQGYKKAGFSRVATGAKDACTDLVRSTTGRMAVRGGMQVQLSLTDGAAPPNNMTSVLTMQRYSQDGVVIVAFGGSPATHHAFLYDGTLSTLLARTSLGWTASVAARPRAVELFEDIYIADATVNFGARQQMAAVNAAGTVTLVTADLGSGAEALRPFCHAVYNNVLFIAGQDSGQTNAPAMVRHSLLGTSPATSAGWDKDAYATLGAAGERVTAMVPGNNVLLIAKENQLYRLSGFGRALPGWQYVVQQVDNTDYVGVKWPGALCYAENRWYGVAQSGPFVTDGVSIDLLVPNRQRTWRQVTALDKAFVRYDPDRRVIIFGLVYGDNAGVQDFWLWRIDEAQWDTDWHVPLFATDVYALAQQGLAGPSKAPASISINDAVAQLTEFSGTVALGDSAASTELWYAAVNLVTLQPGPFLLYTTLAPGFANFTLTDLPATAAYNVKARHVKNGQYSDWSPVATGHTLVAPPLISATPVDGTEIDVTVTQQADKGGLTLSRTGLGVIKTWSPAIDSGASPTYDDTGLSGSTTYTYTATANEPSWPSAISTSASVSAQATTGAGPITAPSAPTFNHNGATLTSITATFTPGSASASTEVWVDKGSGYALDQTLDPGVTSFTVSTLTHSTMYPTQLRHKTNAGDTSGFSASATGYTLLQPPDIEQGAAPFRGTVHLFTTAVAGAVTLYWQNVGGQVVDQWTSDGSGHSSSDGRACGTTQTYKATVRRDTWPFAISTSTAGSAALYTGDCLT